MQVCDLHTETTIMTAARVAASPVEAVTRARGGGQATYPTTLLRRLAGDASTSNTTARPPENPTCSFIERAQPTMAEVLAPHPELVGYTTLFDDAQVPPSLAAGRTQAPATLQVHPQQAHPQTWAAFRWAEAWPCCNGIWLRSRDACKQTTWPRMSAGMPAAWKN